MFNYSSSFKNLTAWCYGTAVAQFLVFFLIFLVVSYTSTFIDIKETGDSETIFTSKYERYIILASSIYMIVPFAFSNVLMFGLFHRHQLVLKVVIIGTLVNCGVILVVVLGSGIFLAIKGTPAVAYSLIGVAVLLEAFLCHSILLVKGIKEDFLTRVDDPDNKSANSDSTDYE